MGAWLGWPRWWTLKLWLRQGPLIILFILNPLGNEGGKEHRGRGGGPLGWSLRLFSSPSARIGRNAARRSNPTEADAEYQPAGEHLGRWWAAEGNGPSGALWQPKVSGTRGRKKAHEGAPVETQPADGRSLYSPWPMGRECLGLHTDRK
ncbi:hypothetical protein NDU88_004842 [Pleurodeles waltl]|uniref:Uncharacterized protein n=1 Tax=Pleurodeles waltl TaxID=8319 RepID=A0AAV7UGA2_PLEWA|nr:hypothetical protein NDU88_004842 [Pleurodeles waltl]